MRAVLLVVVSCAVFASSLGNEFAYDDQIQIAQNVQIRRLENAPELFRQPTWPGTVYRPLVGFSYALTHAVVGLDPLLYHATNVLLHAAVVVLAYLCLLRLVDPMLAFVTAILFAVHPVHVDAVAGVANRTELMAALFGLACVLTTLGPQARPTAAGRTAGRTGVRGALRLAAAGAALLLALLSKESAASFVLLAALCLWLQRRTADAAVGGASATGGVGGPRWRALAAVREAAPALVAYGLALVAYLVLRRLVLGRFLPAQGAIPALDNPLVDVDMGRRAIRATLLLGRYVALLVTPTRLSPDYSLGSHGLGDDLLTVDSAAYGLLVVALLALVLVGARRDARAAFFGLWFLAAFAVTSNLLFPIGTVFGERLAYVPSLGVCGILAWALLAILGRRLAIGLVAVLAVALGAETFAYGRAWRDSETLFRHAMTVAPSSVRVQIGYAEALTRRGALGAARRRYEEALAAFPTQADPLYGIAVVDLEQGCVAEAAADLERVLALAPKHIPALMLLGRLRLREGRVDDAARLFVRALNHDNQHFEARLGLLVTCMERGNLEQARALRAELVALDPTHAELIAVSRELDVRLADRSRGVAPEAGRSSGSRPGVVSAVARRSDSRQGQRLGEAGPRRVEAARRRADPGTTRPGQKLAGAA